jgi:dimethylargininase
MTDVFRFTDAIVRSPAPSVVAGLRAVDRGAPSFEGVVAEHEAYAEALEAAGVTVHQLPALDGFPDSLFVEDPALVFQEGAIVLRPGAPSRFGEAADGGDVLVTPRSVMIGLSDRTDRIGAEALIAQLARLGRHGEIVTTPPGVLHFKSDCSLLDSDTILSTPRLAASGVFANFRVLHTAEGEEGAANALRVNDHVLVSDAYPETALMLADAGYRVVRLKTDEIAKIDAGLSCMSLRWYA